ncbi:MAG: sialidase family protein [bacterium]
MKTTLLTILVCFLSAQISQAQWQPDVRLTNDPGNSSMDGLPNAHCIVSSGDTVHVVWKDDRDGASNEIYYKRSIDGGLSWGADIRISNNPYTSATPSISVSGSVVIIVWSDRRDGISDNNYEIYYSRSTDGGTSWGTDTRLTNDPAKSDSPSISVSGPLVIVVWDDYREVYTKTYYKRSTDGGISWGPDTKLMDPGGSPSVSVSGSLVHIVWNALGKTSYKRSTDGGLNWGANILLTIDTVITNSPSLSVSGSSVHVLWMDSRTNLHYEIYYKHSTDGGITWEADTRLTTNYTSATLFSAIAVSGSNVHVVWDDNRDGNYEIYYKGSKNGGLSWGADTRLTNNVSLSIHPYLSASGPAAHVVWTDNRDVNTD